MITWYELGGNKNVTLKYKLSHSGSKSRHSSADEDFLFSIAQQKKVFFSYQRFNQQYIEQLDTIIMPFGKPRLKLWQ